MRPDHNRVAVDCDTVAGFVILSAVVRGQLGNLRPAGGDIAGGVTREHVRGPAVGSLVVVPVRPGHHRVAIDRHAPAELVEFRGVVRSQLCAVHDVRLVAEVLSVRRTA